MPAEFTPRVIGIAEIRSALLETAMMPPGEGFTIAGLDRDAAENYATTVVEAMLDKLPDDPSDESFEEWVTWAVRSVVVGMGVVATAARRVEIASMNNPN